jgi:hypothetical protein
MFKNLSPMSVSSAFTLSRLFFPRSSRYGIIGNIGIGIDFLDIIGII